MANAPANRELEELRAKLEDLIADYTETARILNNRDSTRDAGSLLDEVLEKLNRLVNEEAAVSEVHRG